MIPPSIIHMVKRIQTTMTSRRRRERIRKNRNSRMIPSPSHVLWLTIFAVVTVIFSSIGTFQFSVYGQTPPSPVPLTSLPSGMPTQLKFGWTGPVALTKPDGTPIIGAAALGQPALAGYLIAVAEANNSTEWLPFTHLDSLWMDSRSDPSEIIAGMYDYAQREVITVFGDQLDQTVTQDVLKRFKIPQIACNSVITEFSRLHDAVYPYFMRNSFSLTIIGREMIRLVLALGYTRASLIYSNEPFALSGSTAYFESAKQFGVDLPVSPNFLAGETDWSSIIQRIVDANVRIIMWLGNPFDLRSLWRFASKQKGVKNIVGDGYLWVLNYGVAAPVLTTDTSTGALLKDLADLAAGQVGTQIPIDPANPALIRFNQLYRATPYNKNISSIHPEDMARAPTYPTLFSYDATWTAIRSLHHLIHDLGVDPRLSENRPLLMQTMINMTFTGATGIIRTDKTGDRQTNFPIANFKRATNTWVPVGYLGPGDVPHIDLYHGQEFEWPGSDPTHQPADSPERILRRISDAVMIGLIVVCSSIIIGCFVLQGIILHFRNHRVLKASSPLFLSLNLIGVQLLCSSVIPRSLESHSNLSPSVCNADLFLANIGYTVLIGALLVKTLRLHQILQQRTLEPTTNQWNDKTLLIILGSFILIEVGVLLGLALGLPMTIQLRRLSEFEDYYVCHTGAESSNELDTIYLPVIMVARFTLLLVTTAIVYRVRHLPNQFNETKQLGLTIYNLLFLSVLLPAIDGTLGRGLNTPVIAYSVCIFLICTVSTGILFAPKLYSLKVALSSGVCMTQAPQWPVVDPAVGPTTRAEEKAKYRAGPTISDGSETYTGIAAAAAAAGVVGPHMIGMGGIGSAGYTDPRTRQLGSVGGINASVNPLSPVGEDDSPDDEPDVGGGASSADPLTGGESNDYDTMTVGNQRILRGGGGGNFAVRSSRGTGRDGTATTVRATSSPADGARSSQYPHGISNDHFSHFHLHSHPHSSTGTAMSTSSTGSIESSGLSDLDNSRFTPQNTQVDAMIQAMQQTMKSNQAIGDSSTLFAAGDSMSGTSHTGVIRFVTVPDSNVSSTVPTPPVIHTPLTMTPQLGMTMAPAVHATIRENIAIVAQSPDGSANDATIVPPLDTSVATSSPSTGDSIPISLPDPGVYVPRDLMSSIIEFMKEQKEFASYKSNRAERLKEQSEFDQFKSLRTEFHEFMQQHHDREQETNVIIHIPKDTTTAV